MGDTTVSAPLILALRDAGHSVGIVLTQACASLFAPGCVEAHIVASIADPFSVLAEVREAAYDVALIATEKPYGYLLAKQAGIRKRVGFWNGFGKIFKSLWVRTLCTDVVFRGIDTGSQHEVEVLFDLGKGLHQESAPSNDVNRLRMLFCKTPIVRRIPLAVQVTPKWHTYGDVEQIAAFFRALRASTSCVFLGAAHEEAFLLAFEAACGDSVERHSTADTWVARIAETRLLLTPDTGAAHVAGMLGTKVIDLFPTGADDRFQQRWRPWASPSVLHTMQAFQHDEPIKIFREACATLHESPLNGLHEHE